MASGRVQGAKPRQHPMGVCPGGMGGSAIQNHFFSFFWILSIFTDFTDFPDFADFDTFFNTLVLVFVLVLVSPKYGHYTS